MVIPGYANLTKLCWLLACLFITACVDPGLECQDSLGCVEIRPNEPIRIGYLLAETGAASFLGVDSKGGIELAIDDRENGVLDHQIELVGEDTGCDPLRGQTAAQALTADPTIVGIIGPICSHVAEAVLPIVDQAGLAMLSPANTDPALTANQAWHGVYSRIAPNNLQQAGVAALFAYQELGARTAVILHDGSGFTSGLAEAFAAAWSELGGNVLFENQLSASQLDINDIITRLSINVPDTIYMALFEPEANYVANSLQGINGLEDVILIGPDNLKLPDFAQSGGVGVNGMYLTGTAVSGDDYDIFLAKWDVKFGGLPPADFHAHAYDAVNILLEAVETSALIGSDGSLMIGRSALRQAIANTTDFAGLTGLISCDDSGDCASGEAVGVYQLTDAEIAGSHWPPPLVWQPKS